MENKKIQEPKTYYCKWLNYSISGVAARNCNYVCLDSNYCRHDNQPCVAKEGLELFAQSSAKCTDFKNFIDFAGDNDDDLASFMTGRSLTSLKK